MNWKRGLLLAGLNLAAAIPMIVLIEGRDARYLNDNRSDRFSPDREPAIRKAVLGTFGQRPVTLVQEEQTVTFSPCDTWVHYAAQVQVVRFGEMPASALVGWRLVCRSRWTLSGWLLGQVERRLDSKQLALQREVDVVLCVLIGIQWLLVGAFPMMKSARIWAEPGGFITYCTLIGASVASVHAIDGLARLPALLAGLAWFWWFFLLVCRGGRLLLRPLKRFSEAKASS